MYQPLFSWRPPAALLSHSGTGSPHRIEKRVNARGKLQEPIKLVDGVLTGSALAEQRSLRARLKDDQGARTEAEGLPNLGRYRYLSLAGDPAAHAWHCKALMVGK